LAFDQSYEIRFICQNTQNATDKQKRLAGTDRQEKICWIQLFIKNDNKTQKRKVFVGFLKIFFFIFQPFKRLKHFPTLFTSMKYTVVAFHCGRLSPRKASE